MGEPATAEDERMARSRLQPGDGARRLDARLILAGLLIFVAILFGGASRLDVSMTLAVELVALGAIGWLVARSPPGTLVFQRGAVFAWAAILAYPLLQLVPLPWPVWTALGGRDAARALYTAMGEQPWHAISLTPDQTLAAFLSLLPPLAMFMLVTLLDSGQRTRLLRFVLALAAASAVAGIVQFAAGETSVLRFYTVTNRDAGVGAFANANHHALFLCGAIVLAFAWLGDRLADREPNISRLAIIAAGLAVVVVLLAGVAAAGSRAGFGMALIALLGGIGLLPLRGRAQRTVRVVAMAILPLLIVGGLAAMAISPGILAIDGAEGRAAQLPMLARMAADLLPFGSGIGSFAMVYPAYEPFDAVSLTYLNQAHNDYLQLAIEAGLPGIAAIAAFAGWWLLTAWRAWRSPAAADPEVRTRRAATLVVGLILLHALVDYPLRTTALATFAAFCCAVMVAPRAGKPLWDSR